MALSTSDPALYNTFQARASCDDGVVQNTGTVSLYFLDFGRLVCPAYPVSSPWFPSRWSFFTKDTKRKRLGQWADLQSIYHCDLCAAGPAHYCRVWFGALNDFLPTGLPTRFFHHVALSFLAFMKLPCQFAWSTKSDQMADKGEDCWAYFL